jgi:Na+-driven multidrug efflux pump
VANELGAGSARRAKFAIYNVVITSSLIGFVLFVLFLFFRGSLAYIFTESRQVANAVADLSPLLAFSILLNSVQPVLSGIDVSQLYRMIDAGAIKYPYFVDTKKNVISSSTGVAVGAGWQSVVAYVNITSYYLIGIPLGAILGYVVGYHVKVQIILQFGITIVSMHLGQLVFLTPIWLPACCVGHLDWHVAGDTGPNYRASVHNIKDRLGKTGYLNSSLAVC